MPLESARQGDRGRAAVAAILVMAFVPVCVTLAQGGADWHLSHGLRLSWHDGWVAPVGLVAAFLSAFLRPATEGSGPSLALLGAWAALGCSALILWTGGGWVGPVSLHHPERSVGLGLVLLVLASRGGLRWVERRVWTGLVLALGLGAGLLVSVVLERIDREAIVRAMASDGSSPRSSDGPIAPSSVDLVWIVVDTLRADALGPDRSPASAGASPLRGVRAATPTLDRLAARGVLFERAMAPAPWTLPAMASLLTARPPSALDPVGRGGPVEPTRLPRLDGRRPTWIGRLREAGFRTIGLQKNPFLERGSGFEASFDLYRSVGGERAEGRSAAQLVDTALRWAGVFSEQRRAGLEAPFALYLHFMDPHIDYRAPPGWTALGPDDDARPAEGPAATSLDGSARSLHARLAAGPPLSAEERERLRRLYAAEVAYLDHQIGRLLSGLEARSLLGPSTLVVLSADHGEQFGEHGGWEHGDLYVENVRVPWIMAGAGLDPARVPDPVSMLDLGPTVLELLGIEPLAGVEGRSRLGLARGEAGATAPGPVVTEYGRAIRWLEPPWVAIEHPSGRLELFDTEADPQERVDRAEHHPGVVAAMRERIAGWRGRDPGASPATPREIDGETRQALRELGYVW